MKLIEARKQAEAQWTAHPCGAVEGNPDTIDYFLAVERERYRQQSWQHDYFDFNSFSGMRVLEIGVGLGTDLVQFAKGGAECHGIDITDSHLALSERNFKLRHLPVTLKKCDATAIAYPDDYFDIVYSFGVIHHIPDAQAVVSEIRRVLKPGGVLLLSVYYKYSLFHLAVLARGLQRGSLFQIGYQGLLATIESGADGQTIKPYVKLHSKRELRSLLAGLRVVDMSVRQLQLGRYQRPWMKWATDRMEPLLGWYLVAKAYRPIER